MNPARSRSSARGVGRPSARDARHAQLRRCGLSTEQICSDTSKIKNRFVVGFRENRRRSVLLPGVKPAPAKISSGIHESLVALSSFPDLSASQVCVTNSRSFILVWS